MQSLISKSIHNSNLKPKDYSRKGNANWNGYVIDSNFVFGNGLGDSFDDSFKEELLTCADILNSIVFSNRSNNNITVTFNKVFLRKIIKSHIHFVREEIS